jgi:hypothetical protein
MPAVLIVFLCLGILFSPLDILGGGRHNYDCQIGVVNTYDNAVELVSNYVEPDDSIFWIGSDTQPVLLGLVEEKDIQLFPQQLNAQYSFRIGGKVEQLSKRGFWNPQLAQDWIDISDILLFEEQAISGWFSPFLPQVDIKEFEYIGETNMIGCSEEQKLSIYRRSQ